MRLLLDTHVLLRAASGSGLTPQAEALLSDRGNDLVFSAASIWEVAIKSSLGRPEFRRDAALFRRERLRAGYADMPISGAHAAGVASLPDIHRDPFDRVLIAQAIAEGITLVTADKVVQSYPGPILAV